MKSISRFENGLTAGSRSHSIVIPIPPINADLNAEAHLAPPSETQRIAERELAFSNGLTFRVCKLRTK